MGSITAYETSAGKRYRVRYRLPDKTQTDKRGFRTKREAELFAASVEVSKARGEYIRAAESKVVVGVLGVDWLASQTHLKPSSLRPVEIAWRLYVKPRWGKVAVGEVTHSAVQTWISELTGIRGATTVLRAFGVLASILDVAVKDRRLTSNPARGVNLPRKPKKEHRYLSHDEAIRLAENSNTHRTLVLVFCYTGLRWGEAAGLRVRDVDFARQRISVSVNAVEVGGLIEIGTPKSHKRRSVAFPNFLARSLREQTVNKSPNDLVFPGSFGQHMKRTRVSTGSRSWFKTALVDSGLAPMTLHDLRHTAASLAISSGANVKAVQRMLGHASAAMTLDVYADLFDDDLDALAQRLDDAAAFSIVGKMWANATSGTMKNP